MSLTRKATTAAKRPGKPRRQDLTAALAERDAELAEARRQQTATREVLKVISRSAFDLDAVFDALLASAVSLVGSKGGTICVRDGDVFRYRAVAEGRDSAMWRYLSEHPATPGRASAAGRVLLSGKPETIRDTLSDSDLKAPVHALTGARSVIGVPLLRDDKVEGALMVGRAEAGPFDSRQIELLETFADQAVIAIQNARLFDEVQARTRDLTEALQQQTATADVLKVIGRSTFDLQAVFDTLIRSAVELVGAAHGAIHIREGDVYVHVASFGFNSELLSFVRRNRFSPGRETLAGRVALSGEVESIPDVLVDSEYLPTMKAFVNVRSLLGVPLLRHDRVEGMMILARDEPGDFTLRQIELVETFADQALIAIENVRLFDEVQARTLDLSEALQQQTATADVLKVISRSAFDLQAVFETLLNSAITLSGAGQGTICIRDGDEFTYRAVSTAVGTEEFDEQIRENLLNRQAKADRTTLAGRAILSGRVEQSEDIFKDSEYWLQGSAAQSAGVRAVLGVPLLRDDRVEGALVLSRRQPGRFAPRVVELVQTFADQAVIAIENVRLFDEVQARTHDLEEALQRQTATAEVLQVISRSAFGLKTVLQTLVDSAVRLCASDGVIYLRHGDVFIAEASFGLDPASADPHNRAPRRPGRDSVTGRVALSGQVEQIPDNLADPEYQVPANQRMNNIRSLLGVPLLRDGQVEGVFVLGRPEPGPFSDRAVELVRTFADQAVIAIENVRLFEEVQARTRDLEEALQQQTATADVLKVISRSAFDLQAVLDTLASSAAALCGARNGLIYLKAGDTFEVKAATKNWNPETFRLLSEAPHRPGRLTIGARVLLTGEVQNVADMHVDPDYDPAIRLLSASRALLGVPLKRGDAIIGAFVLARAEAGAYSQRQIELVQTFADQAVIAIENARLFDEVQAKTRELGEALQQQTATTDVLKVISRSAFDLRAVLETLVTSAATLCAGDGGAIWLRRDDLFDCRATHGYSPERRELLSTNPRSLHDKSLVPRVARSGLTEHIPDRLLDPEFFFPGLPQSDHRTLLGVPLLRDGKVEGAFTLTRERQNPFTARQIELVQTFADQAVIAIENARLFDEVQAKTRELGEALQQQTATTDVLKVISRSAFDLKSVLTTLVESARRLCDAPQGLIFLRDGDVFRAEMQQGFSPEWDRYIRNNPIRPNPNSGVGRAALTGEVAHFPDVQADPDYNLREGVRIGGYRSVLAIPLKRENEVLGVFALTRPVPGPFTQRQIELVRTFADQAVIAIENVRLFEEVRARTKDLQEALQQQTATADVLKVISRSAFDLTTVLDTLVVSAARLCEAEKGNIFQRQGDLFHCVSNFGSSEEFFAYARAHPLGAGAHSVTSRVARDGRAVHIPDVLADPEYAAGEYQRLGQYRTILGVPLLRDGASVGSFALMRTEVRPFNDKQIELVQTFADQAVIAIENARLFDEVQAKTLDLEEALQQQTATANVLKVISRSAFDLQAVFDALISSAVSLIGSQQGTIYVRDGEGFHIRAHCGVAPEFVDFLVSNPPAPGMGSASGRVMLTGKVVAIPDILEDKDYTLPANALNRTRSMLAAPLLRNDRVEGVLVIGRTEQGAFRPRQIELVETFADQAVIAIENARLFDEVQARTRDLEESLQQQTATADVLKAISRSAFDLETVLESLISTAMRLCNAKQGVIFRRHGDIYRYAASHMLVDPGYRAHEQMAEIKAGRGTLIGRVALENRTVLITDAWNDADYAEKDEVRRGKVRGMLGVPLLRNGEPIGAFGLGREEPVPFTQRQIDLVTTFADQAVIAIENVRLFDEVQAKTRDLEESLAQQTATADVLKVISRSAFDLQTVLDTLVASAVQLNGAQSGTICVREGDAFPYRAFSFADEPRLADYLRAHPPVAGRGSVAGRVILSGEVEQVSDILADPEYEVPIGAHGSPARALIAVPLIGKDRLEGVFILSRLAPGSYSARQIEILRTFADQAVIAIENARLFNEVQARTKELAQSLDDLRKAQDRLVQSEKLASLGQLTAGIAHEIKNPLNFINNYSALSRELADELAGVIKGAPVDEATRDEADELIAAIGGNLDKVVQHGKRADSIVKNMLLHSREGSGERSMTNINAMVEEALNLAYHGARAEKPGFNVTIAKSFDPNAGAAEVYAQEMTRVLLNLISNGFYATAKRKQSRGDGAYEPTITASTRDRGRNVEIAIRDNGTGISDEVKAKMFNPFFTTKPAGEGTGLGLSLSHDIVLKQHGGTLEVSTEPGEFTQFTIVLPRGAAGA